MTYPDTPRNIFPNLSISVYKLIKLTIKINHHSILREHQVTMNLLYFSVCAVKVSRVCFRAPNSVSLTYLSEFMFHYCSFVASLKLKCISLSILYFFNIVLALWIPSNLFMYCKISLSIFAEETACILTGILCSMCIELRNTVILIILKFSAHGHLSGYSFY